MSFTVFVNGVVILFMAALMAINALIFPDSADVFFLSFGLAGTFGLLLTIATARPFTGMPRVYTFLLTVSVWLSAALAGALPLWLWKLGPVDAVFEAISGITTTGSTVMSGLDTTPRGILMWRAILQGVGGVGFVVTAMALLPILRVGGMQLFRTESSDKGDKELASATRFAFATLLVYIGLILLCVLVYVTGGMSVFDAAVHAITTLSTGGYSNYDASFGHFDSAYLQWSATLFMLAGGLPFVWYIRIFTRGTLRSEQVSAMVKSLAVVIGLMTLWLMHQTGDDVFTSVRRVAFNVVSVVTTTGYASEDYMLWGPVAAVVFFLLTPVGGCTGSTAGGAKAMRWIIFGRLAIERIRSIHNPHGVFVTRFEGRPVSDDVLAGVMSFFFFYVATMAAVALALGLSGQDLTTAISGAMTAVANVGPGVGHVIGPAGNFASLPSYDKIILSFGMFAGRLEMLTLFVLFTPAFWREF